MRQINPELKAKLKNRKILLGLASFITCVALIAVCSFVPFVIDPTRWQTAEFLTDELIICAIVVFSLVSMMFIAQASNAMDEKSNIAKARANFFKEIVNVSNINFFSQWVKKVLQPKDVQAIKERKMRAVGIEDYSVVKLEFAEVKALLEKPQKYNGKYYKGLSKEQIKVVLEIKSGKLKTALVEPDYYLSVKNMIDNRTISERSADEGKKKGAYLTRSIIFRLILSVVAAMIFASLMRDLVSEVDAGEAWVKFLSRFWSMISSAAMGFRVGSEMNDIDAEYVSMRVSVINMYLQDTDFVPLTEQEEAKQAFVERIRTEQITEKAQYDTKLPMNI